MWLSGKRLTAIKMIRMMAIIEQMDRWLMRGMDIEEE